MKIEVALISVSDKTGVIELAGRLVEMGIRILSTGGTGRALQKAGVPFTPVSEHTGFPEILDGRVKTLHPRIHAGILARHDQESHQEILQEHDIPPIGLVVVNLYPFTRTVSKPDVTLNDAIENIDIGGPTLVRAAAKNHSSVTVVVDPADYSRVVAEMMAGGKKTSKELRFELARKAFQHTAAYDLAISGYLEGLDRGEGELAPVLSLSLSREQVLRYGENPHQRGALYRPQFAPPTGLVAARQHQGKQLSFNNYLDLDAAWGLIQEFEEPACAILKHNNPCGVALGDDPVEAYAKALECDPVSAFGSIVAFNRTIDDRTAEEMAGLFVEAVLAPAYTGEALSVFGRKKNLRVMELLPPSGSDAGSAQGDFDVKRVAGGFLVQDRDLFFVKESDLKAVTERKPDADEVRDLLFNWAVCKFVKSNAIVLGKDGRTIGIGAGQMSRVDSVKIAVEKAQSSLEGAVMASDAFFPFRDGIDEAARNGIRAVIQPGGSVRDEEVIAAADEHEIVMVFTGIRHFRH